MTGSGRYCVALVERDQFGRLSGASCWWRHVGDGGRRWFDSERAAAVALADSGYDPLRWAVWRFTDRIFPTCCGVVSDVVAGGVTAAV